MKERSFEEALERIEKITEKLEDGNLSLKESIENFKEGAELLKFCNKELKEAEMSIQKIIDEHGEIKLKKDGSTGGHKGLESVVTSLGSNDFDRLRFGVGRPPGRQEPADYVLEEFNRNEKEEVEIRVQKSVDIIRDYITEGIEYTMNKYN